METLWGQGIITDFAQVRTVVEGAFDQGWINQRFHDDLIVQLHREWLWYRNQRVVPAAKATTDLQRLALDAQNVHTKEVSAQTSDAQEYLLKTEVPEGQDTLAELETAWAGKSQRKKVMRDVKNWYDMKECVKKNDRLYKRMLDGLWARIKVHKEQTELTQRLWEEAFESVDKCCQGHLSRLANVLVGFTEEVKAEVPIGEILQQRIAAIAEKDIGVEYKVCEAWAVFEELKVPMAERDAWIEAF
jgi:phosphomevalonate kinase